MKNSIPIYIAFLFSILTFNHSINSQVTQLNNLDQNITLIAENITIAELLAEIGKKTEIKFSYNPKKINANKRVDIDANIEPVREVLTKIFKDEFDFKVRGNYVIIVPRENDDILSSEQKETKVSGFVIDEETEDGIDNVSIYTSSGTSTLSDEVGAFSIKLKKKDKSVFQLRKKGFKSMYFESSNGSQSNVNIKMSPIKRLAIYVERPIMKTARIESTKPNVHLNTIFPINNSLKTHQENISDSLSRTFSFSLYPGLSTYSNLSGNIEFNFALNFVGYNRGIEGVEIGILSNINKEDVSGLTLAGLSSYVGGNVEGFQISGIFNVIGRELNGIQIAGISNATIGNVEGVQLAGISNHAQMNYNGLQVSGIYNQTVTIIGSQFAGIMNLSKSINGIQTAGILNVASRMDGLQLSGIMNKANEVDGAQIAGIVNIAKNVKGSQIGLFNVADSITGVPIGLFSFVKKNGYKKVCLYTDELFPVNLMFRTGVKAFHNILFAGADTDISTNEDSFYTFGYGVGSTLDLSRIFAIDFDVTGQYITKQKFTNTESMLLKSYLGLEINLSKSISITGGATFNAYYFDQQLLTDEDFDGLRSSYLFEEVVNNGDDVWRGWLGFSAGLRFSM